MKSTSRIAGLLYLVVVITGMFSLAYVPGQLFVWDNAAKTFGNLLTNETLFRFSLLSSVVCYVAFAILPLILYRLLKPVNEVQARTMVVLALLSVPVSFVNLVNKYNILDLIKSAFQPGADLPELQTTAMKYLNQYDNGIMLTTVFWGLWLLPFGWLVYRSGFLPRFLGVFLMLGCFGYLVNFAGNTISADYAAIGISSYLRIFPAIGEIGTCLWLLIVGAKDITKN